MTIRYGLIVSSFLLFSMIVVPCDASESENDLEGWQKAESDDQYPALYSDEFIDSLLDDKNAYIAKKWRTVPWPVYYENEKLVFTVGWGPLHAGYGILNAKRDTANGLMTVIGKLSTNSFFTTFFRVRDCYRTIIDDEGIYPLFFDQHIQEGKFKANRWDLYDQVRNLVFTDKSKPEFFRNKPFAHSLMSFVYYLRTLSFAPGDSFSIDCFVDTMCHTVQLKCLERKKISVDVGTFDCILVKPHLVGKGRVFSKKDDIRVWFTDDEYKMPVVIESKIRWGTIFAKLIWYSRKE